MKITRGSTRHHYLVRAGIFLITAALVASMVGCDGGGGGDNNPPPSEDLAISTWYDLDAVRHNLTGNHSLMNDLDSTTPGYTELASPTANEGKGWQPIGFHTPHGPVAYEGFGGTFDGQGYEIRDLYINRPDEDCVGLFGQIQGAVIRDMSVVDVTVIGKEAVGGLIGTNGWDGNVTNCYSTGSIIGEDGVGGLVAVNWGTLTNSYSNCKVTSTGRVGGLVGVAGPEQIVSNSYSTGSVTGTGDVGGLIGYETGGNVTNSFWDIETSGQATSAGGTGKNTTEMQDIATFSGAAWDIVAVANASMRNLEYIWNIVDHETYPFLSWQS